MCATSAILDYGMTRIPIQQWTPDTWGQFQEILRLLGQLDTKLDQPDCEDPAKAEWMKQVENRLAKLERKPTISKRTDR